MFLYVCETITCDTESSDKSLSSSSRAVLVSKVPGCRTELNNKSDPAIFQMVGNISVQMQEFNDPGCISRTIEFLHLYLNLNNLLNDQHQNELMDGLCQLFITFLLPAFLPIYTMFPIFFQSEFQFLSNAYFVV